MFCNLDSLAVMFYSLGFCSCVLCRMSSYPRTVGKSMLWTLYTLRELFTMKDLFTVSFIMEEENVNVLHFFFLYNHVSFPLSIWQVIYVSVSLLSSSTLDKMISFTSTYSFVHQTSGGQGEWSCFIWVFFLKLHVGFFASGWHMDCWKIGTTLTSSL